MESEKAESKQLVSKNVMGTTLEVCSLAPRTGFFRDGCCETGPDDVGQHTLCAIMTAEFLVFSKAVGNDLSTPRPEYQFPGLKPGDRWCVCVGRWKEAHDAGVSPLVVLEATHERALRVVTMDELRSRRHTLAQDN